MREQEVANQILEKVGGKENIKSVEHCATRLRLILEDKSKIDEKAIEKIDGVKGQFFAAGQYQVVLGTGFVNKVYNAFISENEGIKTDNKSEVYKNMTLIQKFSRTLGDVFVPIIPILVATGLFMGVRGLLLGFGIKLDPTILTLSQVLTDTAFAFLPALVAYSVVKKFGGSPIIGIVVGLMLVAPQLPNVNAIAGGTAKPLIIDLLGLQIPIMGYQGTVLPALVIGLFAAKVEKKLHTVVPDVFDLIVTPFMTLLISVACGLLIIGPMMHQVELGIVYSVTVLLALPFGIGGFAIGGLEQVVVITGLHHTFKALEVQLLATTNADPFNALASGAITAQGAAALAVAFKTKDKIKKALYFSSVVPAFLGITEPVLFGINLRLVKPFVFGCIGGAFAGLFSSLFKLAGTGMSITSIPGTLLYLNGQLGKYIIVSAIGFIVAFVLTMLFYKSEE
jgi:sucrose PTS system EIIBCA or EIIBC component